jgi:septal ring factor EnvC (AmiA/AmiB activator)
VAQTPRKAKDYKNELAKSKRKIHHMHKKESKLQSTVLDLNDQLKAERKEREIAVRKLEIAAQRATDLAAGRERQLLVVHERLFGAQRITSDVRKENRALAKRVHRASGVLQRAIARTKAKPFVSRLTRKGMYTVHARQMARVMVSAGCARAKVGTVMKKIATIFGGRYRMGAQ